MGRWPGAGRCWKWPELRVEAGAYIVAGAWLLLLGWRWTAALIGAAVIHEAGHLIALWACGVRVSRITVGPSGAKIETGPMEPGQELFCALAGPAAGLMVCLFWRFAPRLALCALVQSAFNLLPIYPVDGGRALRAGITGFKMQNRGP